MNDLIFDSIEPKAINVKIGNRVFTLREATAQAACDFQNAVQACTVYNEKGIRCGVKNLADVDIVLVKACLIEIKDGGYHAVDEGEIRSWPDRIKDKLFQVACEMSNINQPETKEELLKQKAAIERRLKELEGPVKNAESSSETPAS